MIEQQDKQEIAEIEHVNDQLTRGLQLCHSLVDDYRSKLASNLDTVDRLSPANDDVQDRSDLD